MPNNKTVNPKILSVLIIPALVACGGGSSSNDSSDGAGGDNVVLTGVFKDSNVSGLQYQVNDGADINLTDASGKFEYRKNDTLTFMTGGVVIGSAQGQPVISPLELSETGSIQSQDAVNIARYLIMLDSDANPDNGIQITQETLTVTADWSEVDFKSENFDSEVSVLLAQLEAIPDQSHYLPTESEARDHLSGTLYCVQSGVFRGEYTGQDRGWFGITIDTSGNVIGHFISSRHSLGGMIRSSEPIALENDRLFVAGDTSNGATFNGALLDMDTASGSWNNSFDGISGTFSGKRYGSDNDAGLRFSIPINTYQGEGSLALNITDNTVTGSYYNLNHNYLAELTGSVDESGMLSADDGRGNFVVSGRVQLSPTVFFSGTIQGAIAQDSFVSSLNEPGCRLN